MPHAAIDISPRVGLTLAEGPGRGRRIFPTFPTGCQQGPAGAGNIGLPPEKCQSRSHYGNGAAHSEHEKWGEDGNSHRNRINQKEENNRCVRKLVIGFGSIRVS